MEKTDAIMILGHRLNPDGSPSDDLKSRIDTAVGHWRETNAPIIMPCGGLTKDRDITEAEVMRDMLIARGVPAEIIRLEDKSRVTIENIQNAYGLLGPDLRVALVTSDYHVERSLADCKRVGINAYGVSAPTPEGEYRDQQYALEREIFRIQLEAQRRGITDEELMRMFHAYMQKCKAEGRKPEFPPRLFDDEETK